MQQAVAVSDAKNHPEPSVELHLVQPRRRSQDEVGARRHGPHALGLNPPPAPARAQADRHNARKSRQAAPRLRRPRLLHCSTSSSASLSWPTAPAQPWCSRRTPTARCAQQKFVTLIAQPDLYGNVLVLLKSVTDGAHLDDTPRMRLVDAVDAMADNRGELLFELRGATQRQFALYRVLRGQAEKIFVTGGGEFGIGSQLGELDLHLLVPWALDYSWQNTWSS